MCTCMCSRTCQVTVKHSSVVNVSLSQRPVKAGNKAGVNPVCT